MKKWLSTDHPEQIAALQARANGEDVEVDATLYAQFLAMRDTLANMIAKAAKAPKPIFEYLDITPGGALYLLTLNDENRRLQLTKIKQYRADIKKDNWQHNGETIKVANTVQLNDGQHRLIAVYLSGKTVNQAFCFGVTRESRDTVDIGATRSPAQILQMNGYTYSRERVAIARVLIGLERSKMKGVGHVNDIANSQFIDRCAYDEQLERAAIWAGGTKKALKRFMGPAVAGTLFYFFNQVDEIRTADFFDALIHGANLGHNDPRRILREQLATMDKRDYSPSRLELCIRAWNAWIGGKELKSLRLTGQFPAITGLQNVANDDVPSKPDLKRKAA